MIEKMRSAAFENLQSKFFYGWVITAVAIFAMFCSGPGQSHLLGVFFDSLCKDLALPRTSLAVAYGSATLIAALLLPQAGKLIDRFGAAPLLVFIAAGLGLVAMLFSLAFNWIFIAIGFGFLRFLGQGSLLVACANIVSQWFDQKRGFALGLMSLGFPISMAVHPPLGQWLIEQVGWRQAWVWLGIATWLLLLPPMLILLFSKPEQVGLHPDGINQKERTGEATQLKGLTLSEALHTPAFYIICCGMFSLSMLVTALHIENKGILTSRGLDPQTATLMFTVSGAMALLAVPLIGRMLDHFRSDLMFAGGLLAMCASLLFSNLVEGIFSAVLYAMLFGINNGVTMTFSTFFWPRYFGRKHLGRIQGSGQMIIVVGASLGPLPLALTADYLGNYDQTLRYLALIPAACCIAALFLRPPNLQRRAQPEA